jgi:WD40 repeat protein
MNISDIYTNNIIIESISHIEAHPKNDNNIVSLSKDGTVRLWDIDKGKCLVIFECDATFAVSIFIYEIHCHLPTSTK